MSRTDNRANQQRQPDFRPAIHGGDDGFLCWPYHPMSDVFLGDFMEEPRSAQPVEGIAIPEQVRNVFPISHAPRAGQHRRRTRRA